MRSFPEDAIAVIFVNRRTADDAPGYAAAADAMDAAAARQPGYLGVDSVRDADGNGITVSYWASEADAIAWRDQADHARTRARGRERWYESYHTIVTRIMRDYRWGR